MAFSPLKSLRFSAASGRAIARLIGYVERSSEKVSEPADLTDRLFGEHPAIIAFWHGQFMLISTLNTHGAKVKAMVARHGDAELIGSAMAALGVELIRGAGAGGRKKDRGGAQALRLSVRALEEGASLCMTADVPPGPARRAGEGIITLARLSGRPIIPVAVATSRFKALNTWSRMTINLPHSTLASVMGEPVRVPRDAAPDELESYRRALEDRLNAATRRAYELAGADYARATPAAALGPDAPPSSVGLRLRAYRAATRAIEPIVPAWLAWRARKGKEDPRRSGERYGIASAARPEGRLVWVHAASVGETNAALPLVRALGAAHHDLRFLLTTGTLTSATLAASRLGHNALHQFVPLDSRRYANRFLDHWRPDAAIFTESEIWPNLILETEARNIPIALVNARMSQRSFDRWRRSPSMANPLFGRLRLVLAQNDRIGRWFTLLGARDVRVSGNLKIDSPPPPVDAIALDRLKGAIGARPLLLAASTHPGEDERIADAHKLLARRFPGLLTIIVPRHPDRGEAIAAMLGARGLACARRSLGLLPESAHDIYVADTIGELGTFYALAAVAFVGGSLVPHGGQNPIEAIQHGAAVLAGPHTHNFTDSYDALAASGGYVRVTDAATLAEAASALLGDAQALIRRRRDARKALEALTGALALSTDAILAMLPRADEIRRAS